jgi:uncharacterized protein
MSEMRIDTDVHPAAPNQEATRRAVGVGIVDSDVHNAFPNGLHDLAPYLTDSWKARLGVSCASDARGGAPMGASASATYPIPYNVLYTSPELHLNRGLARGMRVDSAINGLPPGSDAVITADHLLKRNKIGRAMLLSGSLLGLGGIADPAVATVLASAYNEWMCEQWLQVDNRFRGAILVPPQNIEAAVAEINRMANRPGIASVFVPLYGVAMGDRRYWPIYRAAREHQLTVVTHPSGTENMYPRAPRFALDPTYFLEWHTLLSQVTEANVVSMICHGVFEEFPELKVVFVEGGFGWVPGTMWKLDRNWTSTRDDLPWLRKPPSEYLMEHIRFTTQPLPEPPTTEMLVNMLGMIYAERTLLFSSDYPHWDFDDPTAALAGIPAALRQRILIDNPLEAYGDRVR